MRGLQARQRGFTLIEMLTVVSVVGILSAVAIPQYALFRSSAYDAQAAKDLREAALSEEALYADTNEYRDCAGTGCNDPVLPGFSLSQGTQLELEVGPDGGRFEGSSSHVNGTRDYGYDSDVGHVEVL